ncbi:MAG: hypothetical protein RLZZ148_1482 [Cyanobacteriota bacterium]
MITHNSSLMQAILFNRYGSSEVLRVQSIPKPIPSPSQVLVRVYNSSVNPVDWKIRNGSLWIFSGWKFPRQLGADFSGVVEAIGSQIKNFQVGDAVFGFIDPLLGGAYAEYLVVKEANLALKPNNVTFEEIAVVPLAGSTALQALSDLSKLQKDQSILINGASGGVGIYALQIAKARMANITAVCSTQNLELVRNLGADVVVDYTKINVMQIGNKYDVIFDVVGKLSFAESKLMLNDKGIYISTLPSISLLKDIIFTYFGNNRKAKLVVVKSNHDNFVTLSKMIQDNKIIPIIDKSFNLTALPEAHDRSEKGKVVGKLSLFIRKF